MSLDNNSANNFQDFLDAIKPYLNYQFYDMSGMGVEAFRFSTDEKPVGQWTDGKLLYAKTIKKDGVLSGNVSINHGIDNIDRICFAFGGTLDGSNAWYPFSRISGDGYFIGISGANRTSVNVFVNDAFGSAVTNAVVTLFYTKTTDSPLASGEKFAGLTSSGEVIYKKHFYTAEIANGGYYDPEISIGKLIKTEGYCKIVENETTISGYLTFPQYFGSSPYEGVSVNVKTNMAQTKIVVYFKTTYNPQYLKIADVNLDVYYTKQS